MKDHYLEAIDREIQAWPEASYRMEKTKKHRKCVIRYRGVERFVVFPLTPSDNFRGHLNNVADVRRELKSMGAKRMSHIPTNKKEIQMQMSASKPAAINLDIKNGNVRLIVNSESPIYNRFVKDGHTKTNWSMAFRPNDIEGRPPYVVMTPHNNIPDDKKPRGKGKGTFGNNKQYWYMTSLRYVGLSETFELESIGSTLMTMKGYDGDSIVFELPRIALAEKPPQPEVEKEAPKTVEAKVEDKPKPNSAFYRPDITQVSDISFEQAVAIVNERVRKMGDSVALDINEKGLLTAVLQIGG